VVLLLVLGLNQSSACSGTEFDCSAPTTIQDRRRDKSALSIVAFNAEWLFWSDGNNGPSVRCPYDHSAGTCRWSNKNQLDQHLQTVADLLYTTNADIIALVEVLDCVVLQCLIDAMGDNTYKPYMIPGRDTATDQNVAIISRIDPITALTRDESRATIYTSDSSCGNLPDSSYESGVSKHFIARFNVAGLGQISLIGVHFLAFPTTPDRCIRREAQATVIRNIATRERNSGRQVVILGDLNDYDRDLLDASNNVPTSRVSDFLKYNGNTQIMYNVVEQVTQRTNRYSSWWDRNNNCYVDNGELTLIDHILVSPVLNQRIRSVVIFNDVWEMCDSLESDHYPIKVVFDTPGGEEDTTILVDQAQTEQTQTEQSTDGSLPSDNNLSTYTLTISLVVVGVFIVIGAVVFYLRKRQTESNPPTYGTFVTQ